MCLCICPQSRVEKLFKYIKFKHFEDGKINAKILEYFEDNFMNNPYCHINHWNVAGEKYRTNNIAESFNRELRHYFGVKNYFNGGKNSNKRYFESLLYQYIKFEVSYGKFKVTRRKNVVLDCKNKMIDSIKKNVDNFKEEEELLIVLRSIMKMGKHRLTKKDQKIIVDDEFFETRNDDQLDNIDGTDGFGSDIDEVIEESQEGVVGTTMEMNKSITYENIMNKIAPMTKEDDLECFSKYLKRTIDSYKKRKETTPKLNKKEKRKRKRQQKTVSPRVCSNTFDEQFKKMVMEMTTGKDKSSNFVMVTSTIGEKDKNYVRSQKYDFIQNHYFLNDFLEKYLYCSVSNITNIPNCW